jgi:hypothetical protein
VVAALTAAKVTARLERDADHDTHAVVDDEAAAEPGGGMNFNTCQPARDVRRKSAKKVQLMNPKPMRQAMPHRSMHAWVAEQYFKVGTSRGIALSIAADGLTQEHVSHATFPL